jgi:hypothetical protein
MRSKTKLDLLSKVLPLTRISARKTVIYKKVVPLLLVAWAGSMLGLEISDGAVQATPLTVVGFGLLAVALGALVFLFTRGLADEVFDCGDHLLVRRGARREKIPLANVMNVGLSTYVARIPKITLRLVKPAVFGSEIEFLPVSKFGLSLTEKNAIADQLIGRAYAARSRREV